MAQLIGFLSLLVRMVRSSQATHSAPFGRVMGVVEELRRTRSSRVRRYAVDVPPFEGAAPVIPAPRRPADDAPRTLPTFRVPADYVPVVDPHEVAEPAALVRGYYVAYERREALRRTDRDRLGLAVLADIAHAANHGEVSA